MKPGSARSSLIVGGVAAAEVAVTGLSVCGDQAVNAISSLLLIGAGALAIVGLAIAGHRFIGERSPKPPDPPPWAWRRLWFASALAAVVAMGLIAALGVEVALTQPARCG